MFIITGITFLWEDVYGLFTTHYKLVPLSNIHFIFPAHPLVTTILLSFYKFEFILFYI